MYPPAATDVLIVGGGPVGLLTGVGLTQQAVDCLVIEKRERETQVAFGRATTLYPRSLELLEQVDLADDVIQEGFVSKSSINYKNGKRVNERGWNVMFDHCKVSHHDYVLNIRQRYSQDVFRARYESYGKSVFFGWELCAYDIDTLMLDGYNITATLQHEKLGKVQVRSKYLLGADGGASSVRHLAGISLDLDPTTYEWVRIDAKLSTDMPDADIGVASIETKSHGNVLWVKLDKDAHRIGYTLTPSILAKYPSGITKYEALEEAVESMKPFRLEFERVDWWTHYKIKQSVAQTLQQDEFILLAGDAAHTHSSGFAQGMNTGIHDATNLIWKLAGAIKGWYKPCVLETYASERRAAAQKLIRIDKEVSAIISGDIPAPYQGLGMTSDEILFKVWTENMGFNLGLGITYEASVLNQDLLTTTLVRGSRSPDPLVRAPGPNIPLRLFDALSRDGRRGLWTVIVFAGNPATTADRFPLLRERLPKATAHHDGMIRIATLIIGAAGSGWAALNGPPLGKFYFDQSGAAHAEYGVGDSTGGIVVIRPDGIVGFATDLSEVDAIENYFLSIVK